MIDRTDILANEIRRVDGAHALGAGALAEALMPWLAAHDAEVRASVLAEQGSRRPCHLPNIAPPCVGCTCGARDTWDAAWGRGYAACRDDGLDEQGEPEWEYGFGWRYSGTVIGVRMPNRANAEYHVERFPEDEGEQLFLVRREAERPASPWMPVEENGDGT